MEFLQEIGIPKLTEDQMQTLSEIVEKAARDYVMSKVPQRRVSKLDIVVETIGSKPVTISVDVDLVLSPLIRKTCNAERLANEASEVALEAAEEYLRETHCRSKE